MESSETVDSPAQLNLHLVFHLLLELLKKMQDSTYEVRWLSGIGFGPSGVCYNTVIATQSTNEDCMPKNHVFDERD